ncbi:DUF134 domain-containing protein [Chloroflexota bacterium]
MSRPLKCRRVAFLPGVTYFKPAGIPLRALEEVRLTVEEVEAIRLKDMERLEQEPASEKMNISRPTFQRVLASARQKVADALLNGKAIRIEGGNFEMSPRRFRCVNDHEWEMPFEAAVEAAPQLCPVCNMLSVEPLVPTGFGWGGKGRGGHRGRCVG